MPRKHSRLIVVDDQRYRWRLHRRGDSGCCAKCDRLMESGPVALEVLMEAAEAPAQQAQVRVACQGAGVTSQGRCCRLAGEPTDPCCEGPASITPRLVASFVEQALEAGWAPLLPGAVMRFRASGPAGQVRLSRSGLHPWLA